MDLRMTEIAVNLKNHDFDACGNYKMDKKEADKFMAVYNNLKATPDETLKNIMQEINQVAETRDIFGVEAAYITVDLVEKILKTYIESMQEWISVGERLPAFNKEVLVKNHDGKYAIAFIKDNSKENWPNEWRIKYYPYDDDVWDEEEHGKIVEWKEIES